MNFNHLFEEKNMKMQCIIERDTNKCKWRPIGDTEILPGNKVSVPMLCERCQRRTNLFLEMKEYKIHEKIITSEAQK